MRMPWLLGALVLSGLIAFLEQFALANYLYWHYPWFDVPMHLLGGIVIATTLVAVLPRYQPVVFMASLAVAFIGWEVVEYWYGIPREANYFFDTALDLLNDAVGSILVFIIARMSVWR